MSFTSSGIDIYQRFELEVRTPRKRLLVDAFLPSPESLPSTVTPPPPPPLPAVSEEEASFMARLEARESAPEPAPEPKRKKASATKKKKNAVEQPKSLQEEVEEFMNSSRHALVPEDDLDPS